MKGIIDGVLYDTENGFLHHIDDYGSEEYRFYRMDDGCDIIHCLYFTEKGELISEELKRKKKEDVEKDETEFNHLIDV